MTRKRESHIDHIAIGDVARSILHSVGLQRGSSVVLLDIPVHGNVGDSLITMGEFELLRSMEVSVVHAGSRRDAVGATLRRIPQGATILLHGGGNLGDLWPQNQVYRLEITEKAHPSNQVIWLPQSVHFSGDGELLRRTRDVAFKRRPTVLLRDRESVAVWQRIINSEVLLCPDMGLIPKLPHSLADEDAFLHLFRRDKESAGTCTGPDSLDWDDIPAAPLRLRVVNKYTTRNPLSLMRSGLGERWSFHYMAKSRVRRGLSLMDGVGLVHTDRLHAAIMALLTGRRVVAHENSYGKISAVLGTWRDYIDPQAVHLRAEACPVGNLGEIHSDELF